MTDNRETGNKKRQEKYEPPEVIHLTDKDRAFGACEAGSMAGIGYRVHDIGGTCVTGKSAGDGCYAGAE
jgi:hypothetical protein